MKNRLNHQIRCEQVRVVDPPMGILTHSQAMTAASTRGADLIEISGGEIPVCVIKELGKWKYEQAKKQKRAPVQETKQVQLRPVTDVGDLQTKARHVREWLEEGHRVLVTVKFRGRELEHPDEGFLALDRLVALAECEIERRSPLENRQIIATLRKP